MKFSTDAGGRTEPGGPPIPKSRFVRQVTAATFFRLVLNTARRFAYPFAPALGRGLDVPITAITSMIAVNQATGVLGIIFGPLADHWGYRRMMAGGMAMLALGMLVAACWPTYSSVMLALFLAGLGKSVFDPAVQAYAGERVSYHRRALAIGVMEFAWAGSTLIGIPLMAVAMDRLGWRSPFWAMGLLAAIGVPVLLRIFDADRSRQRSSSKRTQGAWNAFMPLLRHRAARGALGYAFLISLANDNLFVIYGVWLENSFGMGLVAIGLGTGVIGMAELLGEGLTAAFSDRIGLKRAIIGGVILTSLCYIALPLTGRHQMMALAGLSAIFVCFEFTIVSSLSLFTEVLPDQRATMMAGFLAAAGLGRVAGAIIGGPVWQIFGIGGCVVVSAVMTAGSGVCLLWGLRGWKG